VTLAPEAPEAWAARWLAAVEAGELEAFLAEDWRRLEARLRAMEPLTLGSLKRHRYQRWYRARFGEHPLWVPGQLDGRTLLMTTEDGLGDMLRDYRYVPLIAPRFGGRVVVEAHPAATRLLRHSFLGIAEVCTQPCNPVPPVVPFDTWCFPPDPAEVFATDPKAVPGAPYLRADPALIAYWRQLIGPPRPGRLRVGLNWSGDPSIADDPRRIPLAELAPLGTVPGVELFGLQKTVSIRPPGRHPVLSDPESELVPVGMRLTRLGPHFADLADCAAAMMCLDLVVTCDTSVAHLAGALGRPSWVLLPSAPWWGWELERVTCPWYLTMRLFRQTTPGDWGPVVARVADELAGLMGRR
jgi:hypothetical protein